jgi:hypothetical protein
MIHIAVIAEKKIVLINIEIKSYFLCPVKLKFISIAKIFLP